MAISEWRERLERFKASANKLKDKADRAVTKSLEAAEVIGTASLLGVAEGYTGGDIQVGGVDVAVLGALAAHGYAAFSDTKMGDHFHSIGNGFGAVAGYKGGKKLGGRAKENKNKSGSIFGEDQSKQLPSRQQSSSYDIPGETQASQRVAANQLTAFTGD